MIVRGFVFVAVGGGFVLSAGLSPALSANWQMRPDESTLEVVGSLSGSPQAAKFERFSADIEFDPERLADSRVSVTIDLSSISTGDESVDRDLKSKSWFNAKAEPEARFTAEDFEADDDGGTYVANGMLTLRGVSVPVALRFDLTIDEGVATMAGTTSVHRLDYGVGSGTGETWVADAVEVRVNLVADRKE